MLPPTELVQAQIYRLLEASGPQGALGIAQSLGMKTSRDVNRYLYAMHKKHLLDLDKNSKTWAIYQPGRPSHASLTRQGRERHAVMPTVCSLLGTLLSTWPAPPAEPPRRLHLSC